MKAGDPRLLLRKLEIENSKERRNANRRRQRRTPSAADPCQRTGRKRLSPKQTRPKKRKKLTRAKQERKRKPPKKVVTEDQIRVVMATKDDGTVAGRVRSVRKLHKKLGLTFTKIGTLFGDKTHCWARHQWLLSTLPQSVQNMLDRGLSINVARIVAELLSDCPKLQIECAKHALKCNLTDDAIRAYITEQRSQRGLPPIPPCQKNGSCRLRRSLRNAGKLEETLRKQFCLILDDGADLTDIVLGLGLTEEERIQIRAHLQRAGDILTKVTASI